jgi:hypothetical protein
MRTKNGKGPRYPVPRGRIGDTTLMAPAGRAIGPSSTLKSGISAAAQSTRCRFGIEKWQPRDNRHDFSSASGGIDAVIP